MYNLGKQPIDGYRLFMLILGWGLVALFALFVWALMRSPWGRVLKSIREDEDAARALGKNVLAFKMQSLMLGGVIGSIGGLLLAAQKQSAQPGRYATTLTFFAFTDRRARWIGRVKGPIVGTVIFFFVIQFVDNFLSEATRHDRLPDWFVTTQQLRQVKNIVSGFALAATGGVPAAGHLRRPHGNRPSMSADEGSRACRWPTRPGVPKTDPILVADSVRRTVRWTRGRRRGPRRGPTR